MSARERLISLFEKIDAAHIEGGNRDASVAQLVDSLHSGEFFHRSEESQWSTLEWYHEAYLGRGDILMNMILKNLISEEIYAEMRLAILMYCLTLDSVYEDRKEGIRKEINRILNK